MLGTLVVTLALVGASTANALVDVRETTRDVRNEVTKTVESTVKDVDGVVKSTVESTDTQKGTVMSQKDRIEQRRDELMERLESKSQERKENLEGRRLALCQNRQERINKLLDKSQGVGQRHLENLQRLEAKVMTFANEKDVATEAVISALAAADQKEAAAVATLEVMEAQTFDCATVDGASPSSNVQQIREAKRQALGEYRDGVIELVRAVKQAFVAADDAQDGATQ